MAAGDAPLHIVGWSTAELWGPTLPKYEHEEEPRTLQHTALLICSGLPYLPLFTFPHYLAVPTQSDNPHMQLSLHLALPSTPQPSKNRARPQIRVQQCFQITVTGIRYKDKSNNKRKKNESVWSQLLHSWTQQKWYTYIENGDDRGIVPADNCWDILSFGHLGRNEL